MSTSYKMAACNGRGNLMLRIIKKTLLLVLIIICTLFTAVWAISPLVAGHIANQLLEKQDLKLGKKSKIIYNPFLSRITIKSLSVIRESSELAKIEKFHVEVHLHRFFLFKELYVAKLDGQGISIAIAQKNNTISIAGYPLPAANDKEHEDAAPDKQPNEEESSSKISLKLPIATLKDMDFDVSVEDARHNIHFHDMTLNNGSVDATNQSAELKIKAAINDSPLAISILAEMQNMVGKINGKIRLDELDLTDYHYHLPPPLTINSGETSIDLDFSAKLLAEEEIVLSASVKNLSSNLDIVYTPWLIQSESQSITLEQITTTIKAGSLHEFTSSIGFDSRTTNISLAELNNQVVNWKSITTSDIKAQLTNETFAIDIPRIDLKEFTVSQVSDALPPLVHLDAININTIVLSKNDLSIDTVEFDKLSTTVIRGENTNIKTLVDLSSLNAETKKDNATFAEIKPENNDDKTVENSTSSEAFALALNSFKLSKDSKIVFIDESVEPHYAQNFFFDSFNIGKLHTIDKNFPTPFSISGKSDDYASFKFDGTAKPFADKINVSLTGEFQELSLPAVSSYLKDALGFEIKSGQLDTNISVSVVNDEIDGDTKLAMRGIEMSKASTEQSNVINNTAMPLNVALGLLKDDKDNINLKVPLSGNVSDPNFGVSHFISLVVKKAAMSQAKSYLIRTFLPYSDVINVAMAAGSYALKVRFEDIEFQPGEQTLNEQHFTYLNQLAQLLNDRAELQIKVCPIANPEDLGLTLDVDALDETMVQNLNQLSETRSQLFKQYLVDNAQIDSRRILLCSPKIDAKPPRIKISV